MLEVGFPQRRIMYTKQQYYDFISKWNGIKNIYRSVYTFNKIKNGKPDYDTSKINQIFLDFDIENSHEIIKEFVKQLKSDNLKFRVNFSGGGFHVYIASEHQNINRKLYLQELHKFVIEKYNLKDSIDYHVIGDIKRIRRIENSLNIKHNLYCIPITYQELIFLTFDEIKELAESPRNFNLCWIDGKEIKLESINIDNNINENYHLENSNGEFKEIENVIPEPCIARILHLIHPEHEERFLLCLWLSDKFRDSKDINDFDLEELKEKIISYMQTRNWDDYSENLNTAKSTRYQVSNIINKKYNFVPNCKWRKRYNICCSEYCWSKYGITQ